jgi:hypothetical protein
VLAKASQRFEFSGPDGGACYEAYQCEKSRSFAVREDIEVSLDLSFGIAERKRTQAQACATKNRNAPN